MNSVAMSQSIQSMPVKSGMESADAKINNSVFQNLLTKNKQGSVETEKMKDAPSPLPDLENLPEELREWIKGDSNLEAALMEAFDFVTSDKISSTSEMMEMEIESITEKLTAFINHLLASKTEEKSSSKQGSFESELVNQHVLYFSNNLNEKVVPRSIEMTGAGENLRFQSIINEVHAVFSNLYSKEDVQKASPKILELLQQWQRMVKSSNTSLPHVQQTMETATNQDMSAWNKVVEAFQKREQLAGKQLYHTDSKVTVSDVAKWVSNALETDKVTNSVVNLNTAMPMSKVEQYAIYINQNSTNKTAEQQLMDQFQKIMHSSKLTTMPNGTNQLSIALRPDNLGEMMVRFTQINGEMAVKIMVTTTTAKEMLENNIHQLKNMFSPHQVVIEKQDSLTQSANVQKEQENNHDQKEQQSNHSDQNEQNRSDDTFELDFEQLLMNEKV